MNCIFLACYLPSTNKKYVLREIFDWLNLRENRQTVFVGIQYNSISETEDIIRKLKGNLKIQTKRVTDSMKIDSDASAFIAALELYKESDMNFEKCYFCHTKGITTGNDKIRQELFKLLFNDNIINNAFENIKVGSYAPFLTTTNVVDDIDKMKSLSRFISNDILKYKVMEYYYVHTFFVVKNHILKTFISNIDNSFFNTNIIEYSDRYLFERDFSHIVDMMGFIPAFSFTHGNYSTGFRAPSLDQVKQKINKWNEDNNETT